LEECLAFPKFSKISRDYDEGCPSVKRGITSSGFAMLFFIYVSSILLDYGVLLLYKEIGMNYSYSDSFLSTLGSILLLTNSLNRIGCGIVAKWINVKTLLILCVCMMLGFGSTVVLIGRQQVLFTVWLVIAILGLSGSYVC